MFDHLVDITEPICQRIDSNLASMSIFDTSGIEAWVTENNPKYANRIIKQLKAFAKAHNFDKNFDPYKAAYGSMPAHATANPAIQQMYINGHFCYAYKFGIVTNRLGIVRDITFYNKEFLKAHPDIVVEKKSDSPDEDKSLADSKALLLVLIDSVFPSSKQDGKFLSSWQLPDRLRVPERGLSFCEVNPLAFLF